MSGEPKALPLDGSDIAPADTPGQPPDIAPGATPGEPETVNGGTVWAAWVDVNRAAGNPDPVPDGPDTRAAKGLAGHVQGGQLTLDELRGLLGAFLADGDAFLAKQGHALRLLPGRVNAYRNAGAGAGAEDAHRAAFERCQADPAIRAALGLPPPEDSKNA
jgi:hypothetical protein